MLLNRKGQYAFSNWSSESSYNWAKGNKFLELKKTEMGRKELIQYEIPIQKPEVWFKIKDYGDEAQLC